MKEKNELLGMINISLCFHEVALSTCKLQKIKLILFSPREQNEKKGD